MVLTISPAFEVLSGLLIFNSRGKSSGRPWTVFLGWDSHSRRHCLISRDSSHTHTGRANGRRASQPGPSKGKKPENTPQETLNSPGPHFLLRVFCPHQVPSLSKHLQDHHIAALASLNLFSIKHKQKTNTSFNFKFCVGKVIIQFSPVTQSCPTLCNPMDCGTSGFPVHYQLLELHQTHIH